MEPVCLVMAFYVLHGLIHKFLFVLPNFSANDVAGEDAEPNFDLVEP